jgi:hypothetical protein
VSTLLTLHFTKLTRTQLHTHTHGNTHTHTTSSLLMLVRGRPVYFGPSGAPAFDYVRGLPITGATSPYKSCLNEVVSACSNYNQQTCRMSAHVLNSVHFSRLAVL